VIEALQIAALRAQIRVAQGSLSMMRAA